MIEPIHEIALTAEEVSEILAQCGSRALLVGGQALALWAAVYGVTPPQVLSASITSDADFIGNAALARKLADALKGWDFWQPNLDDATPQTAKLSRTVESGVKQIDLLAGIAGLDTAAVKRRAVAITLASGVGLKVLHPLDVLESRLQNLLLIPGKRHVAGVAQAHLAVQVVNTFLTRRIEEEASLREVLDAFERIGQIATNKRLTSILLDYEIDVLSAAPFEKVDHTVFRMKRWPQITQLAEERRRKYLQQRARRARPRPR